MHIGGAPQSPPHAVRPVLKLRLPAAIMAGFTMEGSCCFWLVARTTIRTVRVGWAALVAVLAPAEKHLVRESIEHAMLSC